MFGLSYLCVSLLFETNSFDRALCSLYNNLRLIHELLSIIMTYKQFVCFDFCWFFTLPILYNVEPFFMIEL